MKVSKSVQSAYEGALKARKHSHSPYSGFAVGAFSSAVGYGVEYAGTKDFSWTGLGVQSIIGGLFSLIPTKSAGFSGRWGSGNGAKGPGFWRTVKNLNKHGAELWLGLTHENLIGAIGERLGNWITSILRPRDPNEKAGPTGQGPQKLVKTSDELRYTIYFEIQRSLSDRLRCSCFRC